MRGWMGLALVMGLVGCAEELPHPEIVSFDIEPAEVVAGDTVVAHIELEHFSFTHDEHHAGEHDAAPSVDHGDEGHDDGHGEAYSPNEGHVHIYLNSVESNPIAQMEAHELEITIPDTVEPGDHVLIARLHNSGHMIIEPQVTAEADLRVVE